MYQLEEAKNIIYNADLDPIVNRLVNTYKWSRAEAKEAIDQYRNYLFLRKKYSEQDLPPSQDIDEVWHAHILHSKEYTDFCKLVFGDYLHHNPGQEEGEYFQKKFETQTQELYKKEFGDYIYAVRPIPIKMLFSRWLKLFVKKYFR